MSTKPNRAPRIVWALRKDYGSGYVATDEGDTIVLCLPDGTGMADRLRISRKDARLLARRINQCLDARGQS